jgi:hypothetical protein
LRLSPQLAGYAHLDQLSCSDINRPRRAEFHGYGLFTTFYATAVPKASRVPGHVYGNADPSYLWPELFSRPLPISMA